MLYKREGSPNWYYRFEIGGREFRGSTRTGNKKLAAKIAEKLREDAIASSAGVAPATPASRLTLADAIDRYFKERTQHQSGWQSTLSIFKHLERVIGGGVYLDQIGNDAISNYVMVRLGEKCANNRKSTISNERVNKEVVVLRAIMRHAVEAWDQTIAKMPSWSRHMRPEKGQRTRYLKAEEVERIMKELPEHLSPVFEFSLLTGVRRANACKLDWSQIDWRALIITFQVKSKQVGGKAHVIPITEPVMALLKRMGPKKSGRVFRFQGRDFDVFGSTTWRAALKRAGVEGVRWHDIRHTTASWLIQRGVPLHVVKEILGHSSIRTTMRYVTQEQSAIREAMAKLTLDGTPVPEPSQNPAHQPVSEG